MPEVLELRFLEQQKVTQVCVCITDTTLGELP